MTQKNSLTATITRGFCLKRNLILAVCVTATVTLPGYADSTSPRFTLPYVGGDVGTAKVQKSDRFDTSPAASGYAGFYLVNNLSVEIWLTYLGQFDVKNRSDTYSQSAGLGTTLAYRIDTGQLFALRPSIGVFYSQTKIVFDRDEIGTDSGADLMFGLSGVFTIRNHVLVNINTHYYKNVSGADIVLLTAGAGYQF